MFVGALPVPFSPKPAAAAAAAAACSQKLRPPPAANAVVLTVLSSAADRPPLEGRGQQMHQRSLPAAAALLLQP